MVLLILLVSIVFSMVSSPLAAERVRFALSIKVPGYELPILAAEDKDFWKENGLEAKITFFKGGGPYGRAMAARQIDIGISGSTGVLLAASRGLPMMMVSDFWLSSLGIWVAADGPIKKPADLDGSRLGMSSTGSLPHIYGQAIAKILGLEGKIRFVALGGLSTRMAALKSGAVDGHISPFGAMGRFQQEGTLHEVLRFINYLPKEWVGSAVTTHKEFTVTNPSTVAKSIKVVLQSIRSLRDDPSWATRKLSQMRGYSPKLAKVIYNDMMTRYTKNGYIKRQAVENLRNFLIEHKLISSAEAPPVDKVYTTRFLSTR